MERLRARSSVLVVVDAQERLARVMAPEAWERVEKNTLLLVEAARLLAVPVLWTEQYPRGLGPTVPKLAEALAALGASAIEKNTFDACGEPGFLRALAELGVERRAAVVVGIEAHVCVYQTARELVRRGYTVNVVADGVTSRAEENKRAGLALAERAGAVVTVAETVVFDWLERAGTPEFKALSAKMR
jgi:nicotinamidase-related amidase